MAALAKQVVSQAGLDLVLAAASAGGDTVPCEAGTVLLAQNTTGAPITITAVTPGVTAGLAIADEAIVVPANGTVAAGPFSSEIFGDPADGQCHLTYSTNVGLSVAAVHVPD